MNDLSPILLAVETVNDSVQALRGDLGVIRESLTKQGDRITALETTKATEKAWLKGAKMPLVVVGGFLLVLVDHWEHGKALLAYFVKR